MGFDVTFHSIGRQELDRFFFDVVRHPALAEERAALLSKEPQRQQGILQLYEQFPLWLTDEQVGFSESFAFAAAIVAGFLHPYWYARGQALSFLAQGPVPEVKRFLTPLSSLAMDVFASKAESDTGMIQSNDSAGGLVLPEQLPELESLLQSLSNAAGNSPDDRVGGVFDQEGWDALQRAIQYARSKGLALLEATDVVVPFSDECYSDIRNLRAHFLKNMEDRHPASKVTGMRKKKEPVPEILKIAKDGTEDDLLERLANGSEADLTPRALAATFFFAAGRGLLGAVTELLKRGVDASATNGHVSGLGMASKYARSEVVKLLLARHAEVDVRTDRGETPLILACRQLRERPEVMPEYCVVVTELLAAGADPNAQDVFKQTALMCACEVYHPVFRKDLTIPRLLISHGADLKHVGVAHHTALHAAAMTGNVPLATLLLEHGHPVDVGGGVEYTPLMVASRHGHPAMVQLLLQHDADPTLAASDATTALLAACEENHLEVVKVLIAAGVDWNVPTAKGTVREIAERRKALDVVHYLDSLS